MEETAIEEIAGVEETPSVEAESSEAEDVSAEDKQETTADEQDEKELNEFTEESREAMQKRIDRATWQRERMKEDYEKRLAELEQKLSQVNQSEPNAKADGAPNEDDFDDISDYYKELGKWEAKQAFEQEQAKQKQAKQVQEYQARMQQAEAKFNEQSQEFFAEIPEAKQVIDDVVADWQYIEGNDMTKQAIVDVVMQADNIPRLMYEVAGNIQELAKLSPLQAAVKIGEMNANLKNAPKKTINPKPKPMTSIKGSGKASKDPKSLSTEEYMAWRMNNVKRS